MQRKKNAARNLARIILYVWNCRSSKNRHSMIVKNLTLKNVEKTIQSEESSPIKMQRELDESCNFLVKS